MGGKRIEWSATSRWASSGGRRAGGGAARARARRTRAVTPSARPCRQHSAFHSNLHPALPCCPRSPLPAPPPSRTRPGCVHVYSPAKRARAARARTLRSAPPAARPHEYTLSALSCTARQPARLAANKATAAATGRPRHCCRSRSDPADLVLLLDLAAVGDDDLLGGRAAAGAHSLDLWLYVMRLWSGIMEMTSSHTTRPCACLPRPAASWQQDLPCTP